MGTAWEYSLLVCVVLAVSSAATAFSLLKYVPPLVLAHWRLQLTTLLLLPGFLKQYSELPNAGSTVPRSLPLLLTSGACLAAHFFLWVTGLQTTSITHALLFVSSAPLIIAAVSLLVCVPLSHAEVAGTLLGFLGSALVATDSAGGHQRVSLLGDLASFGGAVMIIGYLQIGSYLRQDLPLFVYAMPVTGAGAAALALAAAIFTRVQLFSANTYTSETLVEPPGVLDYFTSWRLGSVVLYLAIVPGLFGHTVLNYLLKHLSPLVISVATTLEPAVGSVIGWMWGLEKQPGPRTVLGGVVMVGSLVAVAYGHHVRERREQGQGQGGLGWGAPKSPRGGPRSPPRSLQPSLGPSTPRSGELEPLAGVAGASSHGGVQLVDLEVVPKYS